MKSSRTRIQSLARAMALITAMAELPPEERSPHAFAARTGVTLPSVYHVMNTLKDTDVVAWDTARNYQFGPTFAYPAQPCARPQRALPRTTRRSRTCPGTRSRPAP
jgi:DNA-binding IclR family transcriptional regulator